MKVYVMNTISTLALRGKSYGIFLFTVVMLLTLSATALACACCAEPGTWYQDAAKADPEALAIVGELGSRLGPTASLHLTAAGLEEVKGISPAAQTYTLRRLRPHNRDWKLEFTDTDGHRGTLAFTIPDTAVYYGVDLQDGQQVGAGGPLIYKEWRFEGPVAGAGIFRSRAASNARFRLIFQGRGNRCRNSDDFRNWVLQVKGRRADYSFYGAISPRASQSGQGGTNSNISSYDAAELQSAPRSIGQNPDLNVESGLLRKERRPGVLTPVAFKNEPPIEPLINRAPPQSSATKIQPDYYGAIAYSLSGKRFGSAWDRSSQSEAELGALAACKSADCKIVIWFKNACGSLAVTRKGGISWGGGKDLVEAKRLASNECTRRWGSCKLICSVCSRGNVP